MKGRREIEKHGQRKGNARKEKGEKKRGIHLHIQASDWWHLGTLGKQPSCVGGAAKRNIGHERTKKNETRRIRKKRRRRKRRKKRVRIRRKSTSASSTTIKA